MSPSRATIETSDGTRRYRHRGYEFTVERRSSWGPLKWGCSGISIPYWPEDCEGPGGFAFGKPGEFMLVAIVHEAGWLSWTHAAVIRKCKRAVDRDITARRQQLARERAPIEVLTPSRDDDLREVERR